MVNFTLVTFNLDGREINCDNRLKIFLQIIEEREPDIVVIQEGSRLTYEKLFREMGHMNYKREVPNEVTMRKYGEVIFSKFPILKSEYIHFQKTNQSRGLSHCLLDIEGTQIWVSTTQFETGERSIPIRKHQIKSLPSSFQFLKDPIIFAGDTGILEYQQDLKEPPGWDDAWVERGTDQNKFTLNSKQNIMATPPFCDRVDRVWYYPSSEVNLECINYNLIGNTEKTICSSHFGVKVEFELDRKTIKST